MYFCVQFLCCVLLRSVALRCSVLSLYLFVSLPPSPSRTGPGCSARGREGAVLHQVTEVLLLLLVADTAEAFVEIGVRGRLVEALRWVP